MCKQETQKESGLQKSLNYMREIFNLNQKEAQENCPYCHVEKGHNYPRLFECNVREADASIDLDENKISFDNSDGHFIYGEFKINFCPICGRKLEK